MVKATQVKEQKNQNKLALKANSKPIKKNEKAKWDLKKVKSGDFFSCLQYMKVIEIEGQHVKLENQYGEHFHIEKSILERDSFSADHFQHEVTCNMTELVKVLESAKDTIFKVSFRR